MGEGILEDCTVSKNAEYEVEVRTVGSVIITGGHIITLKERPAIFFTEQSHGSIEGCSIEAAQYIGVQVEKSAVVRLSSCTIYSKIYAITATRLGQITATHCTLNTDNPHNLLFRDAESVLRFNY
jgi:hypothetical protein